MGRPALVDAMSGRTTAGGLTLRSRMPTRLPSPSATPENRASIQRRTGTAQASTRTATTRRIGTSRGRKVMMGDTKLFPLGEIGIYMSL